MNDRISELGEKFVVDDTLEERRLERCLELLLDFCRVTKEGEVLLESVESLTVKRQAYLVLAARYVAAQLTEDLSPILSNGQITDMVGEKKNIVNARLKDLKDEGLIEQKGRGQYQVRSHGIIKELKRMEGEK